MELFLYSSTSFFFLFFCVLLLFNPTLKLLGYSFLYIPPLLTLCVPMGFVLSSNAGGKARSKMKARAKPEKQECMGLPAETCKPCPDGGPGDFCDNTDWQVCVFTAVREGVPCTGSCVCFPESVFICFGCPPYIYPYYFTRVLHTPLRHTLPHTSTIGFLSSL